MRMVHRRIVTVFIVSKDDKLLLGRKRSGSGAVYEDCWHKPGGGVDTGETDEQAVRREVLEETGIALGDAPIVLIYDKDGDKVEKTMPDGEKVIADMQFNNFKVEINKPARAIELSPSDDLIDLTWFGMNELTDLKITPPMQKVMQELGTDWIKFGARL